MSQTLAYQGINLIVIPFYLSLLLQNSLCVVVQIWHRGFYYKYVISDKLGTQIEAGPRDVAFRSELTMSRMV
ncbi:ALI_collapsed_G0025200.mRNA.1.CDS.1 [Saccharomyces cerevisiae]|nr:ALI_collapsed_G0025200.mRNA.1.CDS.1 [Saccharomyces cerevisiae]